MAFSLLSYSAQICDTSHYTNMTHHIRETKIQSPDAFTAFMHLIPEFDENYSTSVTLRCLPSLKKLTDTFSPALCLRTMRCKSLGSVLDSFAAEMITSIRLSSARSAGPPRRISKSSIPYCCVSLRV